jgi:hypothetical protein
LTIYEPSPGLFVFSTVVETPFNDVDAEQAAEFAKDHTPHSTTAIETPVVYPLWTDPAFQGRRVAIKTMLDATFPATMQDEFLQGSGVDWQIVEPDAG